MKDTFLKTLTKIGNKYAAIKYNEDFSQYTSLNATIFVKCIIEPKRIKDLIKIIKILNNKKIRYVSFTYGTNSYITDENLVLINLKKIEKLNYIEDKKIVVSGNQQMAHLASFYKNMNIDTFLGGTMIPGSIGAGIKINASVGDISINKYLKKVYVITKKGRKKSISKRKIRMSYRTTSLKKDDIIYKAEFKIHYNIDCVDKFLELLDKRKNQPKGYSLGSTFLNTCEYKAWELIDKCGLRGFEYNGFVISNMHANFIINKSSGNQNDFENLIFIIKLIVLIKTGYRIKEEVVKLQ